MKKLLSIILCAVMLLSATVTVFARHYSGGDPEFGLELDETYTLGDVNGDGDVNSLDAAWVLKYDAEMLSVYQLGIIFADVNSDGNVDSLDAARILKYDAGILESVFENAVVE